MGCASSKRVEATIAADVYKPGPTSLALFDITAIEEPWLISAVDHDPPSKPISDVPPPILASFELTSDPPLSWSDVSRALENLKPSLNPPAHVSPTPDQKQPSANPAAAHVSPSPDQQKKPSLPKNPSLHTLEELDARLSAAKAPDPEARVPVKAVERIRPLRENSFIIRDRLEREGKRGGPPPGDAVGRRRRDPFDGFPEKCPPGGRDAVVLYTTTLRGVRRTFEDCERVRTVVEGHRVPVDERDVALHGGYLAELRELLGEGEGEGAAAPPRLFVKGRYVGGVEKVVELNESGRLSKLLKAAGVGRGLGRRECEGCGGARFVPCLRCNGSCKVVDADTKATLRCELCNENGLAHCPLCHPQ